MSAPAETKQEVTNDNFTDLLSNLTNILKRTGASNRTLPSWDSSQQKSAVTIKSHIKLFENLAQRMGWSEDEKALELLLTLKGQARKYAESLDSDITSDYKKLKDDLIKTFTRRKPEAQRLREWNACRWDVKKQTLTEFAAMLMSKLKKLNDDDVGNPDSDLFLKNRFLEAIKDENPEFGRYLDLNRPEKQEFQELVTFCQSKYDVFCSVEAEDEERKSSDIFYNFNPQYHRRNTYPMDGTHFQYPMFFPFPYLGMPNLPNQFGYPPSQQKMDYQENFKNRFQAQKPNSGERNRFETGLDRERQNKEKERMATKVPKDHKVRYVEETNTQSKNL